MSSPRPIPLRFSAALVAVVALAVASMLATTSVTVTAGDTVTALAREHDVSVAEIVAWNGLDDPDRIFAGDVLVVADPDRPATVRSHRVALGETLSAIARRYDMSLEQLARLNGLEDPDVIREGQELRLDAADATVGDAAPASSDQSHTVVPGESLWSIASRYGLTVDALVSANAIDDPDLVRAGTRLRLMDQTGPDAPATTTPPPTAPAATTVPPTTTPPATPAADDSDAVTRTPLADAFHRWSADYGVPRDLLEAIAWAASDWQPAVTGPDGRLGIAQLRPEDVELVEDALIGRDLDPLATSDGIQLAARYLRYVVDRTDDDHDAIVAFRQGLTDFLASGPTADAASFANEVEEIRRIRS